MQYKTLRRLVMAMAAGIVVSGAAAAKADPLPNEGVTLQEVDGWLKAGGFQTQPEAQNNLVVAKYNDQIFVVGLGDCQNQHCQSLTYFYGIKFDNPPKGDDPSTALFLNGWNANYRWAKASMQDSKNIAIDMDVSLNPGGNTDQLNESLKIFLGAIQTFRGFLANGK
jgi:hypothetical protein